MKRIAPVVFFCVIVGSLTFAQDKNASAEQEILASIRARLDALAHNDLKTWSSYVAGDLLTPLEDATPSKQTLMKERERWPEAVKYYYGELENVKVRLHGDTAVVTYRAKQYNNIGGQITYMQTWQTETHVRKNKGWVLVAVADAPIPLEPSAAKIDPKILDAYVGEYQYAPNLIAKVTRVGDTLVHKMPGASDDELLPESETTFFIKDEAAGGSSSRTIFVKDNSGRVTHYIYRQYGATDRIVKKIR